MSLIGYARVSTAEQHLDAQLAALNDAGCSRVFTDQASGARTDRPELAAALDYLREGDTLVVWKLDRLGRSLAHLVHVIEDLEKRGVEFRSLSESIDTTTPGGRLVFHMAAAFAQFERDLIRERTNAGLEAARAKGKVGGRPSVMTADRIKAARDMYSQGATYTQIGAVLGVSRSSVSRALNNEA
ncbi:MAG: recombinase family protein [Actinomycetaceae bacterium]|nr:recombinase family protein [Actinomycetaceae bacterium]